MATLGVIQLDHPKIRVDPPRAFLRVADDGKGLGSPRTDSYGMEIMRERTSRVGAGLTVRNRVGGGTVVEVTLGSNARPRETATSHTTT